MANQPEQKTYRPNDTESGGSPSTKSEISDKQDAAPQKKKLEGSNSEDAEYPVEKQF